jgi:DNA-directed RNA polymerase alpha subunit
MNFISSIDKEYTDSFEKKIKENELMRVVFDDLKRSNDCYVTDLRIEDDVLYLNYWYYGKDSEEERLEKVRRIAKGVCDFDGTLMGVNIRDIKITIKKVDFTKENDE